MTFTIMLFLGAAFVFDAIIGSFLNVCIYRIPAQVSIVRPGSRCPKRLKPIRWYHNILVASWLPLHQEQLPVTGTGETGSKTAHFVDMSERSERA